MEGNSVPSIGDKIKSAKPIGDTPITLYVYVENVDNTINKAINLGAKIIHPIENHFYGDRAGTIIDPFNFKWNITTHIKNPTQEEMNKGLEGMKPMLQIGGDINKKKYLKYKNKYLSLKTNNSFL